MKTYKIVRGDYNEETGVSIVDIATKLGNFRGVAVLQEEDKDFPSSIAGCRYAEIKAIIKFFKRKKLIEKTQLDLITEIIKENKHNDKLLLKREKINMNFIESCNNIKTLTEKLHNEIKIRDNMISKKYKKEQE